MLIERNKMPSNAEHWETIYSTKDHRTVSWYTEHLSTSLTLIDELNLPRGAVIVDVGGGASTLAGDLLDRGFTDISVVDISPRALEIAREKLGEKGASIKWTAGDIRNLSLPAGSIDLWHDRAVFHFLTGKAEREDYRRILSAAMKSGSHLIISTFGPEGPARCSGLDIVQYSAEDLARELGTGFRLLKSIPEEHQTPRGGTQAFIYCVFQKI